MALYPRPGCVQDMAKRNWETTNTGLRCLDHDEVFKLPRSCPKCSKKSRAKKKTVAAGSPAPVEPDLHPPSAGTGGGVDPTQGEDGLVLMAELREKLFMRLAGCSSDREFVSICAEIRKSVESNEAILRGRTEPKRIEDLQRQLDEVLETIGRSHTGGDVEPPPAQDSTEAVH